MNLLHGSKFPKESEKQRSPQEINRIYNDHFHAIHTEDGVDPASFVDDDMFQIFYPKTTGTLASIKKHFILSIFDAFVEVVPYDQQKYDMIMQQIICNKRNDFIASNHGTFANLAIIGRQLYMYAHIYNHKEKRDTLHTFLAPSLTTQKQGYLLSPLSHLVKTFTINPRSLIEGLKTEIQDARNAFKDEVNRHAKKQGNMFVLAPGGTRDALQRGPHGEVEKIYMENNLNIKVTSKFLRSFIDQGDTLVLEGMNETAIKRPDKTDPKNHTRTKGKAYVDMELFSKEEALDVIRSNTLLERIARLTKDKHGHQIGQVVSREDMKAIKDEMEHKLVKTDAYPKQDFDDDILKMTTRGLFNLFKNVL
ncbi:MAG: hypothetical protein NTX91_00760 [candidate division SR1 bacterium]|nr:hypothetical protein [candidate division SR1 bacterium]